MLTHPRLGGPLPNRSLTMTGLPKLRWVTPGTWPKAWVTNGAPPRGWPRATFEGRAGHAGWFSHQSNEMFVSTDLDQAETIQTVCHELIHAADPRHDDPSRRERTAETHGRMLALAMNGAL